MPNPNLTEAREFERPCPGGCNGTGYESHPEDSSSGVVVMNQLLPSVRGESAFQITNTTDSAIFIELLFKGQVVNAELDQEMIELLTRQAVNDRIPAWHFISQLALIDCQIEIELGRMAVLTGGESEYTVDLRLQ